MSPFGFGLRERARALLHLDDPPWKLAAALALGVFISFTPLLGFQTLLALVLATVLRLNRAATVTGTWMNLPWFMPFVYAAALWLGEVIVEPAPGRWVLPLLVGSTILGAVAAVLTWLLAFGVMTWRVRRARRSPAGQREAA